MDLINHHLLWTELWINILLNLACVLCLHFIRIIFIIQHIQNQNYMQLILLYQFFHHKHLDNLDLLSHFLFLNYEFVCFWLKLYFVVVEVVLLKICCLFVLVYIFSIIFFIFENIFLFRAFFTIFIQQWKEKIFFHGEKTPRGEISLWYIFLINFK